MMACIMHWCGTIRRRGVVDERPLRRLWRMVRLYFYVFLWCLVFCVLTHEVRGLRSACHFFDAGHAPLMECGEEGGQRHDACIEMNGCDHF